MSIKVLIVDDHGIVRDGLRALLQGNPGMDVVGDASNGLEAIKNVRNLEPDVVLMDASMPVMNGIEATRKICTTRSKSKIIGLSAADDKSQIIEMMKAGARGYVNKLSFAAELVQAVEIVSSNRVYISPEIGHIILDSFSEKTKPTEHSMRSTLSAREISVLQLLSEGYTTKETGEKLNISVKTVGNHRDQIKNKLNIHSIAGLTKYALREKLTEL